MCRRVGRGMARLEEHRHLLTSFDPEQRNAGALRRLSCPVGRYRFSAGGTGQDRSSPASPILCADACPCIDYLHVRMAEGMVAMAEESKDEAIQHFDFVLGLEQETDDKELLAIANFWKGRCLRMKGEYDQALAFAVKGRALASELGHAPMAAVMRVLESWLWFQKGGRESGPGHPEGGRGDPEQDRRLS